MQKVRIIQAVTKKMSDIEMTLSDKGITIEMCEDFQKLERICNSIEDRKRLSEPFSTKYFDILPRDGFWIRGFDQDGKTVSTQVMRLSELGETNLATLWQQQLKRLHGGKLMTTSSPGAQRINGRVVYHGDVWVDRSCARLNLGGIMSHLALSVALLKWAPDFVYGFMRERLCLSGFALKEGYFHCEPIGSHWVEQPREIDPSDWLVWMGRHDLEYLAQHKMISGLLYSR
jgi:hypothetical protein